jgi:lysophospholipase L1-like esterase
MGRFKTGMKGPDAIRKLNELDDSVAGAVDGAAEAIRQAEAARDDTFTARDQADGYRAIAVAAGLTATEKAAEVEAGRQQVAADAAAEATAQDRAAVAQIVADGADSLGQQLAAGIDEIGTASTTALDGISTARASALQDLSQASSAALSSISTEVGKVTTAANASEQSRAQAAAAADTATGKAEQTTADARETAADRQATAQARSEAVAAAATAIAKAQQTAADAEATGADRQATDAARGEAVTAAGTATSKAQATAADAEATAADRQIVVTARGEAIQGATDALAAADTAEGHVEAAAAILASVQAHGNGWTPTVALAADGERRVMRVLSWAGGVGTPPAAGYLAESGVVADPALAINVRGGRGADGTGTGTANSVNNVPAIEGNITLQIGDIPGLQAALAAAGQVKTVAGVSPGADGDVPLTAADVGADPAGTAAAEVETLGEALAAVAYTGAMDDIPGLPEALTAASAGYETASAEPPANPKPGDQWLNTTTGISYTYTVGAGAPGWVERIPVVTAGGEPGGARADAVGITAVGDSITAYGYGEKGDWLTRLCFYSHQLYRRRETFAIGGKTAQEIEAELLPQVLAMDPPPRACVVAAGSNNYFDDMTVDAGFQAVERMCSALVVAGILPVLWTVPPRGDITGSLPRICRWNAHVHRLRTRRGFPLLDAFAALADPATGTIPAALTTDGTHPTDAGAAAIASYALADSLFAGVPQDGAPLIAATDLDTSNLMTRGLFTADSGTPGVPQGLYSWGTHGASLVPGAPRGRWLRLTRSAGAAPNDGNVGIPNFPVVPGRAYDFVGRLESAFDAAQPDTFNGLMALVWHDANDVQVKFEWLVGTPGLALESGTFYVRAVAPAGAAKCLPIFQQSAAAAAPTVDAWFQVNALTARDVT